MFDQASKSSTLEDLRRRLRDDAALSAAMDPIDASFAVVVEHLRAGDTDAALARIRGLQRRLDAVEGELLAARRRAGATDADQHSVAGRGTERTRAEAARRARRADAIVENPALAEALDAGDLTAGQLDAIATGSQQSEGAAARDNALIEQVQQANPDQARTIVRSWLDRRRTDAELEAEQQRTRSLRKVTTHTTERGTKALIAEGDHETIDQIHKAVRDLATTYYRHDGGRDVPAHQHPRTRDQRMFDALHHLVTRTSSSTPSGGGGAPTRSARPTIVITDTSLASGQIVGTGPIPATTLERLACHAHIVGAVFAGDGQPLWLSRGVRTVSPGQWVALVARDQGCVLCGAHPDGCEAHHVIPWHAPAKGRTDIDNLALLCASCHHHVHAGRKTLVAPADHTAGTWRLRPATPAETPPPRPVPTRPP